MDEHRFDDGTIRMSNAANRRQALRALAGMVAGGALLLGATDGASARASCRPGGASCRKAGDCCSGFCLPPNRNGRRVCGCPNGGLPCDDGRCPDSKSHQFCCGSPSRVCSCFIAGTRIAMAGATSKPIELIEWGDLVLGENGSLNRVIGIERPVLGERRLYAINGGPAFVTSEHPFMTAAGWKSFDPAATAHENPSLAVGRLEAGDELVRLVDVRAAVPAGQGLDRAEIVTERIALRSIAWREADPLTPLYNLLLDGDHTYFANELLVHNKA